MELPAADGGMEARLRRWRRAARWCSRQPSRRRSAALRLAELVLEAGFPAGRRQHPRRLWRDGGRRARRTRHGGQGGVHRLDRSRQADRQGRRRQPQEGLAGARRQVAGDRVSDDADLERAIPGAAMGIFFNQGQTLLRRFAAVRAQEGLRSGGRWDLQSGAVDQARRRPRSRYGDGPAGLRRTARPCHRLYRVWARRKAPRSRPAAQGGQGRRVFRERRP